MTLKSSFNIHLLKKYPDLQPEFLEKNVSDQLLSPFQIHLDSTLLDKMKSEIKAYWNLRSWSQNNLSTQYESLGLRTPKNFSACMSYDFHLSAEKKLELIEINTNAAFLALGTELYAFWKLKNQACAFSDESIVQMFREEIKLCGHSLKSNSIAIFDENPEQQRLYVEFLLYQQMFEKQGIKSSVVNQNNILSLENFSLVYNRFTDFYLQNENSKTIKDLFNSEKIQLSPNPYEYFLLADKQRLIDWNQQSQIPKPESLLPVYDLAKADREEIWQLRKSLFFKPKTSFGGKQAYRGASISKKAFDSIFQDDFIAQKNSTPPEIEVDYKDQKMKFKYDIRCFAYQQELQMVIARLYQGQTTNLATAGGGFACVVFS